MWIVVHNNLSACMDFNKLSEIHTNYSKLQLREVIRKEFKPIDFYSIKLTGPQKVYGNIKGTVNNDQIFEIMLKYIIRTNIIYLHKP